MNLHEILSQFYQWYNYKPNWLKGGLIGILISLIISFIGIINQSFLATNISDILSLPFSIFAFLLDVAFCGGWNECPENNYLVIFILATIGLIISFFIIGSIIGYIFQIIKKYK
ncbi:MAG: hypothetical protein AB7V77_02660 [Candidatus Woesearchaeota archaeon]